MLALDSPIGYVSRCDKITFRSIATPEGVIPIIDVRTYLESGIYPNPLPVN